MRISVKALRLRNNEKCLMATLAREAFIEDQMKVKVYASEDFLDETKEVSELVELIMPINSSVDEVVNEATAHLLEQGFVTESLSLMKRFVDINEETNPWSLLNWKRLWAVLEDQDMSFLKDNNYSDENLYDRLLENTETVEDNHAVNYDGPTISVSLDVVPRTEAALTKLVSESSNWLRVRKSSEVIGGVTLETIPLRLQDAVDKDWWRKSISFLEKFFRSKKISGTRLHVRLSSDVLGANEEERRKTVTKVVLFFISCLNEESVRHPYNRKFNDSVFGTSRTTGLFSNSSIDLISTLGFSILENPSSYGVIENEIQNIYGHDENHFINIKNVEGGSFIEFRKGKGNVSATRICGLIAYCKTICDYCRTVNVENLNFEDFYNAVKNNPLIMGIEGIKTIESLQALYDNSVPDVTEEEEEDLCS